MSRLCALWYIYITHGPMWHKRASRTRGRQCIPTLHTIMASSKQYAAYLFFEFSRRSEVPKSGKCVDPIAIGIDIWLSSSWFVRFQGLLGPRPCNYKTDDWHLKQPTSTIGLGTLHDLHTVQSTFALMIVYKVNSAGGTYPPQE
jgi:hypothetical protein